MNIYTTQPVVKRIEKPWGYEIKFSHEGAPYSGKIIGVNKGSRLSLQYHDSKVETLCLFDGEAYIELTNEKGELEKIRMEHHVGYFVAIGQKHRIEAITECKLLEVGEPEKGNTYRLEDDYGRPTETEEMRKKKDRGWSPDS